VASDGDDSDGQAGTAHEPRECMACRGTGRVISNLGGTPSEIACPWCGGAGLRVAGRDAQAAWIEKQGDQAGSAGEPAA
jgi:DnaJ-class molecular chaperone